MGFGFPAYHTENFAGNARWTDQRAAVCDALDALGWSILESNADSIVAAVGVSFWSWGERVAIHFLQDGNLSITSRCALPTQCIDWGKNQTNVATLSAELRKAFRLDELMEQRSRGAPGEITDPPNVHSHEIQEGSPDP